MNIHCYSKEYRGIHNWVERRLGKPKECWECGTSVDRKYQWANVSGEYKKDISDWRRLCIPCHMTEKNGGKCKNGHEFTQDNTYLKTNKTNTGSYIARVCRTCKRDYEKTYRKARLCQPA